MSYKPTDWDRLAADAQQEIMEGALAYQDLKTKRQDYSHWVRIGRAFARLQREAMALVGVNQLQDPKYRRAFADLLKSEKAGELGEIASGTRSHAVWLADNFAAVEQWLAGLGVPKRLSLNHPTTIWRQHPLGRKAEALATEKPTRKDRRTNAAELNFQIGRLDDAMNRAEFKIAGAAQAFYDLKTPELIRESARNFLDVHGRGPTLAFIAALHELLNPAEMPTGEDALQKTTKPRRKRVTAPE